MSRTPICRRLPRSRRAMALGEVLLAIVLASALLGLLAATISRVMVANTRANEHLDDMASIGRLAEQFRRDVRQATRITHEEPNAGAEQLRLESADESVVTYTLDSLGLVRDATAREQAPRHELFALPGMRLLGWNDDFAQSHQVTLRLGWLTADKDQDTNVRNCFSIRAPWHPRSTAEARP